MDPSRAHIDAETLAAWVDRGLPAEAADAVELHLSQCDHCQEVLAAFVRSEPAAPDVAVVLPFWSRRPVKWSAAGLAAAAAIVAFVWMGLPQPAPAPESTITRAPIDSLGRAAATPSAPAPAPQASPAAGRRTDKPAAAVEQRAAASPSTAAGAVASAAAPPPPSPQAFRQATAAESAMKDSAGMFVVVAPDAANPAPRTALQSAAAVVWRVVGGLRVERSTDAGTTWTTLPITPALKTPLVAGAATSRFVCWFVGDQGVVIVTTDGRTLRRVSLPEAVRLVAVTAVDGSQATVTAADGRMFSTLDGGLTWR